MRRVPILFHDSGGIEPFNRSVRLGAPPRQWAFQSHLRRRAEAWPDSDDVLPIVTPPASLPPQIFRPSGPAYLDHFTIDRMIDKSFIDSAKKKRFSATVHPRKK